MNEEQDEIMNNDALATADNDHDQVMAHFQEITNFYDMEQCIAILESTQWNLDQAIQSFFNGGRISQQMDEDTRNISPIGPSADAANQSGPDFPMEHLINNHINAATESHGIFATGTSILPQPNISTSSDAFSSLFPGLSSNIIDDFNIPQKAQPNRLINFNIEYFQKKFKLHMPDNETVLGLKELIAQEIGLSVEDQKLKGWKNKDIKVSDHMKLRELNLPLENNLFVINTSDKDQVDSSALYGANNVKIDSFELSIQVLDNNKTNNQITIVNKSSSLEAATLATHLATETFKPQARESTNYHLHFEPHIKFIEIKRKISMLTSMSVGEQEWWLYVVTPEKADENTSLESLIESGSLFNIPLTILIENDMKLIDLKILLDNLTETNSSTNNAKPVVSSDPMTSTNSKLTPVNQTNVLKMSFLVTRKKVDLPKTSSNFESVMAGTSSFDNEDIQEDDSHCDLSVDEEDLDENFVMESVPKQKSLIPASCPVGDEMLGTTMFIDEFFKRYQPIIPIFYNGLLENAIKEAVSCPAKDRKLLGIYLHSDNSVCRHIFCSKTLCDENVVNFLTSNFVVWPWDLTNKEHEAHFYTSCSKHLGSVVTSHLRTNKIVFPAFLIVNRTRGTNEVIAVIEGTASSETMMHRLMQAYEMFEAQRVTDMRDESERDEREQIKRDQDAAYRESLEADKAKRQKQDEEQERQRKLAEEEENVEKQKEVDRQKLMQNSMEKLPAEPTNDAPPKQVSRIRFRLPNGEMLQRRFLIENTLESLFHYLTANGYFTSEFKVLSSWPRRDLTTEETERTLEDLKLFPQETLTLEER